MNIDKYLYEIFDDYKNATSIEEQNDIFNSFCTSIWGSNNKRRVYTKLIRFKVRDDLLNNEIGQIFNVWSEVEYVGYKAMSQDTDWCSLIRQKINNLYTRYFDKEVILNKEYIDLLKTPYNLYYRWIKGAETSSEELTDTIENAFYKATELKAVYQKQKMELSWEEYKKIIEGFLRKIFQHCQSIEDYENENLANQYLYELANEDNLYIKCFCRNLDYYMLNYQKEYYNLKRGRNKQYKRCKECGALIENKSRTRPTVYCEKCKVIHRKNTYKKYNKKR